MPSIAQLTNDTSYYKRLRRNVEDLVQTTKELVAEENVELLTSNRPTLADDENALRLIDPRLHHSQNNGDPIWLVGHNQKELRHFLNQCLTRLISLSSQWKDVDVENALWFSLLCSDAAVFALTLRLSVIAMKQPVADCMLSSLLHQAIQDKFFEAVTALLVFGANPTRRLSFSTVTLTPVDELLQPVIYKIPRQAPFDCFGPSQLKIFKKLVNYGADLTSDNANGLIPLHHIGALALHSPKAASFLLKSTPLAGYICVGRTRRNGPLLTPLAMSFNDIFSAASTLGHHDICKAMSFAILPLIKSGAPLEPDITSDDKLRYNFERFVSLQSPDFAFMLRRMVMDARMRSNVRNNFISSPLPLQTICRQVINKNLPTGLEARAKSVASLPLPRVLIKYLRYSDYEQSLLL